MYREPGFSPWGELQDCEMLCPGVFMVTTPGHGGTMVSQEALAMLSPAAVRCGTSFEGWLCFEEDCQENVVFRELLDKGLWQIPSRVKDKAAFEEHINKSLREYNPNYWRAREQGREAREKTAPARHVAER